VSYLPGQVHLERVLTTSLATTMNVGSNSKRLRKKMEEEQNKQDRLEEDQGKMRAEMEEELIRMRTELEAS